MFGGIGRTLHLGLFQANVANGNRWLHRGRSCPGEGGVQTTLNPTPGHGKDVDCKS